MGALRSNVRAGLPRSSPRQPLNLTLGVIKPTTNMEAALELSALIDRYCEAWSEHDEHRRAELLSSVWAEGGSYTDPTVHAVGVSELLAHIAKVQARRPGSKVMRTSEVDEHHRVARFAWCAIEKNGNALTEGIDLVFLPADGSKLERIIGFFGSTKSRSE